MRERQFLGVQEKTIGFDGGRGVGVKPVPDDGVPECLQVHTQLVCATGFGRQGEARGVI